MSSHSSFFSDDDDKPEPCKDSKTGNNMLAMIEKKLRNMTRTKLKEKVRGNLTLLRSNAVKFLSSDDEE